MTYCYAGNCQQCNEVRHYLYHTSRGALCWVCVEELGLSITGESWGGENPGERDYSPAELEQEKLRVEELGKSHQVAFLEAEVARLKDVIKRRNRQLRALRSA